MKVYIPLCLALLCLVALATEDKKMFDNHRNDNRKGHNDKDDKGHKNVKDGKFHRLSAKEVRKDRKAFAALEFGVEKIIAKAIKDCDIPKGKYIISKIVYAARQHVKNGINFRFTVEIKSKKGNVVLIAKFRVFVSKNGKRYLRKSSHEVKCK